MGIWKTAARYDPKAHLMKGKQEYSFSVYLISCTPVFIFCPNPILAEYKCFQFTELHNIISTNPDFLICFILSCGFHICKKHPGKPYCRDGNCFTPLCFFFSPLDNLYPY